MAWSNAFKADPVFIPVVYASLEEAEDDYRRACKTWPEANLQPSKQLLELRAAAQREREQARTSSD